jgi:type I restriction enzyme, S subunit
MKLVEANEPWLGKVPSDWKRSRIRNEAILSPGFSSDQPTPTETCAVVPMESLSTDGAIDFSNQQPFEDIPSGLTLFERGDVLFAKITPCMENGKGAFVSELPTRYAFGSTEFHVLRPCHRVDGRFLYYATFDPTFRAYAAENMTGAAGQKRVSSRFLKDTRLFLPPLQEQQRTAAYLDLSFAAIDAAVAAKRRQLQTLDDVRESLIESAVTHGMHANAPMRPVNEDWITEIPAHWEVCRIKRIVSRVDYGISESTEPQGRYPVLKMGHIQRGEIEYRDLDFVDEVSDDLLLQTGDLLYNRTNSPDQVGKAAIFRRRRTDEITFASYLVRLRTNHRADPYFLNYLVNSKGFLSFARKLAIPSVQQSNLNSTRYCRMLIPRPPIEEQREIAVYLDRKLGELGHVVGEIEQQMTILTVYRKSLIHECVTGQRRITETDVQRAAAQRKFDNLALTG